MHEVTPKVVAMAVSTVMMMLRIMLLLLLVKTIVKEYVNYMEQLDQW